MQTATNEIMDEDALRKAQKAAYKKAWRLKNIDRIRAHDRSRARANGDVKASYKKAWADANRDRLRISRKAYRELNRERLTISKQAYREANRDKLRAKAKATREANPEKERAQVKMSRVKYRVKIDATIKRWQAANPEKVRAAKQKWAVAHPEQIKAMRKAWKAANPDKLKSADHVRRARKRAAMVGDQAPIIRWWKSLRKSKSVKCYWCAARVKSDELHMDHIIPLAKGGAHSVENLCVSCGPCNLGKGAKLPSDWNAKLTQPVLF